MKNTTKLFAAAVVAMSFAVRADDFFTTETKEVLGAAVGGAVLGSIFEEQWSNGVQNWQTASKQGKAGYLVVGSGLTFGSAYLLNKAVGFFDESNKDHYELTEQGAIVLLAALAAYVYQQKGRSEAEQQAPYDYAGQGLSAAQAQAAKVTADASRAKTAAPAQKAVPAKK